MSNNNSAPQGRIHGWTIYRCQINNNQDSLLTHPQSNYEHLNNNINNNTNSINNIKNSCNNYNDSNGSKNQNMCVDIANEAIHNRLYTNSNANANFAINNNNNNVTSTSFNSMSQPCVTSTSLSQQSNNNLQNNTYKNNVMINNNNVPITPTTPATNNAIATTTFTATNNSNINTTATTNNSIGPSYYYKLRYQIAHYKYCHRIKRSHKSNGIMIEVDFRRGTAYQLCWDPECRNYRSPPFALPRHVLPGNNHDIEEVVLEKEFN